MNYSYTTSKEQDNDYSIISDQLYFISEEEKQALFLWRDRNFQDGAEHNHIFGSPIRVLKYNDWRLNEDHSFAIEPRLHAMVSDRLALRKSGIHQHILLDNSDLLAFIEADDAGSSGQVAILPPDSILAFLKATFPLARMTPALQRLMTCYMGGYSLAQISVLDGKSADTLKSQTRELKLRLGLKRTEDIGHIVSARLLMNLGKLSSDGVSGRNAIFERYAACYLPDTVHAMTMLSNAGELHRFLDMGPRSGTPLICLHPVIFSDIRPQDIALLDDLNLRLIWPLRNGLLAPDDPALSETEQIRHACDGIDLVRRVFFHDQAAILSFNASSKVALAYASRNADRVRALFFAGVSIANPHPTGRARRFLSGMTELAARNRPLMNAAVKYFCLSISTHDRLVSFFRRHYRYRPVDRNVVENELRGSFGSARFRDALVNSVNSIRHDFAFQRTPCWEIARTLNVEMHFMHGAVDTLHPLPLVKAIADSVPGSSFHPLKGAGDLLYHDHLRSVLTPVAARLAR